MGALAFTGAATGAAGLAEPKILNILSGLYFLFKKKGERNEFDANVRRNRKPTKANIFFKVLTPLLSRGPTLLLFVR
jgi:hypothetical protein